MRMLRNKALRAEGNGMYIHVLVLFRVSGSSEPGEIMILSLTRTKLVLPGPVPRSNGGPFWTTNMDAMQVSLLTRTLRSRKIRTSC